MEKRENKASRDGKDPRDRWESREHNITTELSAIPVPRENGEVLENREKTEKLEKTANTAALDSLDRLDSQESEEPTATREFLAKMEEEEKTPATVPAPHVQISKK